MLVGQAAAAEEIFLQTDLGQFREARELLAKVIRAEMGMKLPIPQGLVAEALVPLLLMSLIIIA
jgi:hypothetical protein